MSERVERNRRGLDLVFNKKIFRVVPDLDILIGHLKFHHGSFRVVELIVRYS